MEFLLDHTSHKQFSRLTFLCQGFCAELLRFFSYCHANANLAPNGL